VAQTRRASGGSGVTASQHKSGGGRSVSRERRTSRVSSDGAGTSSGGLSAAVNAVGQAGKTVTRSVAFPVASAMAGAAAGLALAQRQRNRRRKVLGVPIPGTGDSGVDGLAKNICEAGKQFARLADEVSTGRRKAEEIGKALS
jgi:hypothetical protein